MDSDFADWDDRRVMVIVSGLVDEAWAVMQPNLTGLTDAEYLWEPGPDCWSIRRRGQQRSPDVWGRGEWVVEISSDGRVEPAMTSIAWRLMHAFDCTNDFTSRAFGRGAQDWNLIDVSPTAAGAVALVAGAIDTLRTSLAGASDDVLRGPLDADFRQPRWLLLDKALLEAVHHVAEVGALRALFRLERLRR